MKMLNGINKINFQDKNFFYSKIVFWVVLLLLLLYKLYVLINFSFKYTDSDQVIMWLGTLNYASGHFYEPRFYGQAYNSMLESLLAVPLYKIGVPLRCALPFVTTSLSLFPYFLLATILYRRKSIIAATLVLCVLLIMPVRYDMLTTLSRGFVVGLALASLLFFFLLKRDVGRLSWVFVGFISVVSFSINPNSLILVFPVLFYFLLQNIRNKSFYLFGTIGLIIGSSIHLWIQSFYWLHPKVVLHDYNIKISWTILKEGFDEFNLFFADFVPIMGSQFAGWFTIAIFLVFSCLFFRKKDLNKGFVAVFIIPIIVFPMLISKTHDGNSSIFFSLSRMFLGVPIIWGMLLSFLNFKTLSKQIILFFTVVLFFCFYKVSTLEKTIKIELTKKTPVGVIKNNDFCKECQSLYFISEQKKIDLILVVNHWYYDFYTYGCQQYNQNFPTIIRPSYDRRIWLLREVGAKVYRNVLVIDMKKNYSKYDNVIKLSSKKGYYLIKDNCLKTILLMKKLDIVVRDF